MRATCPGIALHLIWWRIQIIQLFIMNLFQPPVTSCFLDPNPVISSATCFQHPCFKCWRLIKCDLRGSHFSPEFPTEERQGMALKSLFSFLLITVDLSSTSHRTFTFQHTNMSMRFVNYHAYILSTDEMKCLLSSYRNVLCSCKARDRSTFQECFIISRDLLIVHQPTFIFNLFMVYFTTLSVS
jgi:hypothetical protein